METTKRKSNATRRGKKKEEKWDEEKRRDESDENENSESRTQMCLENDSKDVVQAASSETRKRQKDKTPLPYRQGRACLSL